MEIQSENFIRLTRISKEYKSCNNLAFTDGVLRNINREMIINCLSSIAHHCQSPKPITSQSKSGSQAARIHWAPKPTTDTRRSQKGPCIWRGRSHSSSETGTRMPRAMQNLNWRYYHLKFFRKDAIELRLFPEKFFRRKYVQVWVKRCFFSKLSEDKVKCFTNQKLQDIIFFFSR